MRSGADVSQKTNMLASKPEAAIAPLMRPQGDTGIKTHFNAVYRYLRQQDVPVSMVTRSRHRRRSLALCLARVR
jgi:hypothetical protein